MTAEINMFSVFVETPSNQIKSNLFFSSKFIVRTYIVSYLIMIIVDYN